MPKTIWQALIFIPIYLIWCFFGSIADMFKVFKPKPRETHVFIGRNEILALVYIENDVKESYSSNSFEPDCWLL